ncbi:MAG: type II toxin-antitoxin system VapC family toxin [Chloroflexi bacterium]|nr:type II toxin-antitoxin system VapC family toxin [Chloroflexota bacterium]
MNGTIATKMVAVDASLVAMWVLPERYSSLALRLASDWARAKAEVIAPAFMFAEVTNAVSKRVRRGELSLAQAQKAMQVVLGFGVRQEDEQNLYERALELAHRLNRPSPYDAIYMALAEFRGCELWTGDERLYNATGAQLPWLRWVGAYTP